MKKRADEIGGQFLIDSSPGKGTIVQLNVAV
jgi:signal transduction histidine kinase